MKEAVCLRARWNAGSFLDEPMDATPPKSEPAGRTPDGARPLQPRKLAIRDERLSHEERQQRDRERLLRMQLEGFDGPTWWTEVRPDVWVYASTRLPGLIQKGEIFTIRVGLGAPAADDLRLPATGISVYDAEDLASDVALGAIAVFQRQLRADRWDLAREMTFRSWFVNLCALRFPAPYRLWLREQMRCRSGHIDPDVEDAQPELSPSSVIYVVEFERALRRVEDSLTKAMICFDLAGYTDKEIAKATSTTLKTVERRLAREREKSRKLRDQERRRENAGDFGAGVA